MSKTDSRQLQSITLQEDCILLKVTSDALSALRLKWSQANQGLGFIEAMSKIRNGFWKLDFRRKALDGSELPELESILLREFTFLAVQEILAELQVFPCVQVELGQGLESKTPAPMKTEQQIRVVVQKEPPKEKGASRERLHELENFMADRTKKIEQERQRSILKIVK